MKLAPNPLEPRTLFQDLDLSEFLLTVQDQVSCGNGFIPPESRERMTSTINDLRTRLDLVLEVHPEVGDMILQHEELLKRLRKAEESNPSEVPALQQQCAALAKKIVAIEQSVDVGD